MNWWEDDRQGGGQWVSLTPEEFAQREEEERVAQRAGRMWHSIEKCLDAFIGTCPHRRRINMSCSQCAEEDFHYYPKY